jgi:hypothetical protein
LSETKSYELHVAHGVGRLCHALARMLRHGPEPTMMVTLPVRPLTVSVTFRR